MPVTDEHYKKQISKFFPNLNVEEVINKGDWYQLKRVIDKRVKLEKQAENIQHIGENGLKEGDVVTDGKITGAIITITHLGYLCIKGQRGSYNACSFKHTT